MTRTAQTTTLIVTRPTDFSRLESRFKLVRYELPERFRGVAKSNKNAYGQMHNSLRDQIDFPYKTFKYDRLDGVNAYKWAIYVLYPRNEAAREITIPLLSDTPLRWSEIQFADLASLQFHLLLKLLQIAYFRGEQTGRFVGQDRCYVFAKTVKENYSHICLEIELRGDIQNEPGDVEQTFKVIGHATRFKRVDEPKQRSHAYFGRKAKGGKAYFIHLKQSQVDSAQQRKEAIYEIRTREGHRTTLAYHNLLRIEESVGKLLYDFIQGFTAYLVNYGIQSRSKERTFTEFIVPPKDQASLPLSLLNPISVFDNRLQHDHALQEYLALFAHLWPELAFIPVVDLTRAENRAVLVIQDHNKEDFEQDGILQLEWKDPYIDLYMRYPYLPKQSINVNPNDSEHTGTATEYLHYAPPNADSAAFQQKLEMALNQLYLKDVILHQQSIQQRLPLVPVGYAFIRKDRYYSATYETLLWTDGDALHFIDLRDEKGKMQRDELFSWLGIDWEDMYDRMLCKYRRNENEERAKDLPGYDLIIGPGIFTELEDLNERVLYDYGEITRRQAETQDPLPIDALKLAHQYDEVRPGYLLSFEEILGRHLLGKQPASPKNEKETASITFYRQLEEFDAFLEEIRRTHQEVSFNALTQGERMERIGKIFDIHPDERGHYHRRRFKDLYQRLGLFSSEKAKDVHFYQGIWYDEDRSYMVGSPTSMNQRQPRAHLIRRFDVYTGESQFDIRPFLLATSVQFVRLNQYTVYPYAFHLIDLYVENVLRFQ